jgi:hypothetical protein
MYGPQYHKVTGKNPNSNENFISNPRVPIHVTVERKIFPLNFDGNIFELGRK